MPRPKSNKSKSSATATIHKRPPKDVHVASSSSSSCFTSCFNLKTLVLVLLLCTSLTFSVLYLKNINYNLNLNLENFNSNIGGTQENNGKTRGKKTKRRLVYETGQQIVEKAYRESYKFMVDYCASKPEYNDTLQNHRSLAECMKFLHDDETSQGQFPWWFETLLRDSVEEDWLHSHYHVRILRTPTHIVEFCSMEKVASSEWGILKCLLDGKDGDHCWDSLEYGTPGKDPKAVFLRDPLERFLSGFVDKCAPMIRDFEGHCEPNEIFSPTEGRDERKGEKLGPNSAKYLKELAIHNRVMFDAYTDVIPLKWNIHFFPASLYCNGLYRTLPTYDFVGTMASVDIFHDNLLSFATKYNMQEAVAKVFDINQKDASNSNTAGTTTTNIRNPMLKKNRTLTASQRIKEYYTPKTLKRVLQFLSIDYAKEGLALPLPDWVDEILAQDAYYIDDDEEEED